LELIADTASSSCPYSTLGTCDEMLKNCYASDVFELQKTLKLCFEKAFSYILRHILRKRICVKKRANGPDTPEN
jgi:hypothetical protein